MRHQFRRKGLTSRLVDSLRGFAATAAPYVNVKARQMTKQQNIAKRVISAVSASGQETKVLMRIGTPYEVSENEWACPVGLDGLHDDLRDQHGIDSWQA